MDRAESLAIIKALADESRLKILDSLVENPQCVEALATRLGLSSPTISFHCKKLEQAGLVSKKRERYYVVFQTNHDAFALTLKELVSNGERLPVKHANKLRHFKEGVVKSLGNEGVPRHSTQSNRINAMASEGCDDYCSIMF